MGNSVSLWRIFSTEQQCAAWCRQQFAQMARERAQVNAGVLFDYTNGKRPVDLNTLPDGQITGQRFPLWGKNEATGEWNTEDGFTTAWAEPRETIDGQWAAPCRNPDDPNGQPEPEWPTPEDDTP
jgi:hypothetical protein